MPKFAAQLFLLLVLAIAGNPGAAQSVVVAGDSVMAWNAENGNSVALRLEKELGVSVLDVSVSGARISHSRPFARIGGFDIRQQLKRRSADWVVLDGGANDLGDECGCSGCGPVLDQLISPDGTRGEIPGLVAREVGEGAHVIYGAYYRDPQGGGPFSACNAEFDELRTRLDRMAARSAKVTLVDFGQVIERGNAAHYDPDRVHPSPLGSARIGALIAQVMKREGFSAK